MKRLKKILAVVLVIAITLGIIPSANIKAATEKVDLERLKDYGTITINNKSNSEWFRFNLKDGQAFCMDMGEACHSGYTYKSSSTTYYTYKGSDKHKKIAKIGAWFTNSDHPKRAESDKYFVIMQALLWGVDTGLSNSEMKKLTQKALSITDTNNSDLYDEVFGSSKEVDVKVTIWEYKGKDTDQVQKLLEFDSSKKHTDYKIGNITLSNYYRQRINIVKEDENKKRIPGVTFNITAKNVMQLYSYGISDSEDDGSNNDAEELERFSMDATTAENGMIKMRFTYKVFSQTYYYIENIEGLDADTLKEAKEYLDDNDKAHGKDYKKSSAESAAESNLKKQMKKINNSYVIKEVGSEDKSLVISDEWKKGKTITLDETDSWTRDSNGKWPDNTSGLYSAYPLALNQYITNEHKIAKWTLNKTGEQLTSFDETKGFVFTKKSLKDVEFEVKAKKDVTVNRKKYFSAGDKVATIKTGTGVEFTNTCEGKCTSTLSGDGNIVITFPLGQYEVREVKTVKNHLLPDKTWDLNFDGSTAKDTDTYVYDYGTCVNGVFNLNNSLVGTSVKMVKTDGATKEALPDTTFGFYTKDDVYNVDGEVIVNAGTKIATVTTGEDGIATVPFQLPLKDNKNTGDFYFIEEDVPEGYLLDETPINVHLESSDDAGIVEVEAVMENEMTEVEVDKTSMVDGKALDDCDMKITDTEKKPIVTWTTGNAESITKSEEYKNLATTMTEDGNVIVRGLHENEEYTLSELRAKDGYLIANDITFKLSYAKNEEGKAYTKVFVKDANGEFVETKDNKVVMEDDITKIDLSKKGITGEEEIPGCDMEVQIDGETVDRWISGEEPHRITGLTIGKTYTLIERRPSDGFASAENIEFTIQDTGEVQTVTMHDETIKVKIVKVDSKNEKNKLPGAEFVFKLNGKKVAKVTTDKNGEAMVEGILAAGVTYDVEETKAPEGFKKKAPFKYTVKDTGEIQVITVKDKRDGTMVPDTPNWSDSGAKSPKTGYFTNYWLLYMALLGSACVTFFSGFQFKRLRKDEK